MSDTPVTPRQLKTEKQVLAALRTAAMTFDLRHFDVEVSSRASDGHFSVKVTVRKTDGTARFCAIPFDYDRVLYTLGEPTDTRAVLARFLKGMPDMHGDIQAAAEDYLIAYTALRTAHVILAQKGMNWSWGVQDV